MSAPRSRILVIFIFFFLFLFTFVHAAELPRAKPEEVGLSSERLARLDKIMQRYVDENKLAGVVTLIARRGKIAHLSAIGKMSLETGEAMKKDSLFRLHSQTKPITSVALLTLFEEGHFLLSDPVENYIPAFKDMKVFNGMDKDNRPILVDQIRKMTIHDVFRHTSGFGGEYSPDSYMEKAYKDAGIGDGLLKLKDYVERLGKVPLSCQPGTQFIYSASHDVQAYLVEYFSGIPFDKYLKEKIFKPLGMNDTSFGLPKDKLKRYTTCYASDEDYSGLKFDPLTPIIKAVDTPESSEYLDYREFPSGGSGLISTAEDYFRFAQMLLNKGKFNGHQILGSMTVELMSKDHLPKGVIENSLFLPGHGYGLGVAVVTKPEELWHLGSEGEYWWWVAATTRVVINPVEEMIIILLTQIRPLNGVLPFQFETLAYQAIID